MAREAVRRGLRPLLAGRDEAAVSALAAELGLEFRVFDLGDGAGLQASIGDCRLVLHCAGPFSKTSRPMLEACLAQGVHYLDISGEVAVFQYAHAQSERARRVDVLLLPGVGFDVVPSDCLAVSLVEALPAATRLCLAFEAGGGASPGTAKTSVEGLAQGGLVRRGGELKRVPLAWKTRRIPFAHAERSAVTIPWGDVYTAHVSTGIPDIEVYMALPASAIRKLRRLRWLRPALALAPVQAVLKRVVASRIKGPSGQKRAETRSELWGEATTADGRSVTATMTTPNGYDLTVSAGLGIVAHLLENDVEGGFYTPSMLMGSGYAASLPGVTLRLDA